MVMLIGTPPYDFVPTYGAALVTGLFTAVVTTGLSGFSSLAQRKHASHDANAPEPNDADRTKCTKNRRSPTQRARSRRANLVKPKIGWSSRSRYEGDRTTTSDGRRRLDRCR